MISTLAALSALTLCPLQSVPSGSPDAKAAAELTVERVVIFKDGHGLVVKRVRGVADASGELHTSEVPDSAVLGTFWAWSDARPVIGMRVEPRIEVEVQERQLDCTSTADLLEANVGRRVSLILEESRIEGRILSFMTGSQPTVMIETEREGQLTTVALPVARVRWIEGQELATTLTRRTESKVSRKRLTLQLGAESAGKAVSAYLIYFTPDVRWIPTYRVSGELTDGASLALQGELLNELEDLSGAQIDLVVGVPHFRFGDTISPLSLEKVMRNALVQAAPNLMSQVRHSNSNVFSNSFSSRATEHRAPRVASPGTGELPAELEGGQEGDLYVFSVEPGPFPKGSRLSLPLFEVPVGLRHLHTLDLDVGHDDLVRHFLHDATTSSGSSSPLKIERSNVWHQLELRNDSPFPWTTGAALVLRRGTDGSILPLGQDLLTYTPRGTTCELPVTVAVNVRSHFDEEELSRDIDHLRWNGNNYSLIRKRGTLRINNSQTNVIELRVRLGTGGKVTQVSDDGTHRVDDFHAADWGDRGYHWRLNQHSDIAWDLTLEPGRRSASSTSSSTTRADGCRLVGQGRHRCPTIRTTHARLGRLRRYRNCWPAC